MILHAVYCDFLPTIENDQKQSIFNKLSALCDRLDGVLSFDAGPNRDFEGKSQKFSDGFIIKFTDVAALQNYANHKDHLILGGELCSMCTGGANGIIVFDLEV